MKFICFVIHRVKNLNAMPEVRDKVYDPDPEKVFTKAKLAQLQESQQDTVPKDKSSEFRQFPDDSTFHKDYSVLPLFVPTDTLDHLKECGKTTKKSLSTDAIAEMSSSKGLRLMPFVHDLEVSRPVDSDVVYVRALCWASYKKSVNYKVRMIVNPAGKPKITSAVCDLICPAGKSGCCCHVMAVIWKLDEMSRNNEMENQCDNDVPCTSKPRKWGIPGRRTVEHEPIMASKLIKPWHNADTPGQKRRGVLSTFYDPRPLKLRKLDPEAVEKFKENIVRVNQSVPFGKMTPNASDMILVNSLIGTVAKGSVLQMQMKDFNIKSASSRSTYNSTYTSALQPIPCVTNTTVSQVNLTNTANDTDIVVDMTTNQFQDQPLSLGESTSVLQPKPCVTNTILSQVNSTNTVNNTDTLTDLNLNTNHLIDQPFSLDQIHDRCSVIKKNLFIEDKEIKKIEAETRGQSNNQKWFNHRFGRITASKCHRVACPHKANTSPTKIIKDVLRYTQGVQTKAMKDGIENEDLTISQYVEKMKKDGHEGLEVQSCGFFVSKSHGFLGASPDGLVTDESCENPLGLVEVKNIKLKENETLKMALVRKGICNKNGIINKSHQYYYQIQQQAFVAERTWCDFVVRGSNNELFQQRVPFNMAWWKEKLVHLENFFDQYILPELAYPRLKFGLDRYDFKFNC